MNISLIAAIGKNNELGKNNDLIWKFKEDMKFFKETTMEHPVVMGRKTFESLPNVLPGRKNIIISRSNLNYNEIEIYKSIRDFLVNYENYNDEIFIIGGASIYSQFIDIASKMYLTEIDVVESNADVYFPKFDINDWNKEIIKKSEENMVRFNHVLYKRK